MKQSFLKWAMLLGLVIGILVYFYSVRDSGFSVSSDDGEEGRGDATGVDVAAPRSDRPTLARSPNGKAGSGDSGEIPLQDWERTRVLTHSSLAKPITIVDEYSIGTNTSFVSDEDYPAVAAKWKKKDEEMLDKLGVDLGLNEGQLAELAEFMKERREWSTGYQMVGDLVEEQRSLDSVFKDMLDSDQVAKMEAFKLPGHKGKAEMTLEDRRNTMRAAVKMSDSEVVQVEAILRQAIVDREVQMSELGFLSMRFGEEVRHLSLRPMAEKTGRNGMGYLLPTGEAAETLKSVVTVPPVTNDVSYLTDTLGEVEKVLGAGRMDDYRKFVKDPNSNSYKVTPNGASSTLEVE